MPVEPLSRDTKWIVGILLAITTVVLSVAAMSWQLARTVATKDDLAGLATSVQLDAATSSLRATVDDLGRTVSNLQAVVDGLQTTVRELQTTVRELQTTVEETENTTATVDTLIGTTLPALFMCMMDMSAARRDTRFPDEDRPTFTPEFDSDLAARSEICSRLRMELAAVETPLVPQLPE